MGNSKFGRPSALSRRFQPVRSSLAAPELTISTYLSDSVRCVSPSKKMQAISTSHATDTGKIIGADSGTAVITGVGVGVGSSGILVAVALG